VEVFDNVLNEANADGWHQLQTVDSGSQSLLTNAERYAAYLASAVNDTSKPAIVGRNNIGELRYCRIDLFDTTVLIFLMFIHHCYTLNSFECSDGGPCQYIRHCLPKWSSGSC